MIRRSSKSAGAGFLSALMVASRKRTLVSLVDADSGRDWGLDTTFEDSRADLASDKCALEGGLKLESRT